MGGEAGRVALADLRARLDVRPLPAAQQPPGLERLEPWDGVVVWGLVGWLGTDPGPGAGRGEQTQTTAQTSADWDGDGRTGEGEGAGEVEADGLPLVERLLEGTLVVVLVVLVTAHAERRVMVGLVGELMHGMAPLRLVCGGRAQEKEGGNGAGVSDNWYEAPRALAWSTPRLGVGHR